MSRVGETGVGEMGIGETGVGEMGVGETGPNRRLILQTHRSVQCTPPKKNQKLIDGSNRKTNKFSCRQVHSLHHQTLILFSCIERQMSGGWQNMK